MTHDLRRVHTVAGDSHRFECTVTDSDVPKGIEDAEMSWYLFDRAYDIDPVDAVLSSDDANITIITDPISDTSEGEFQVRIGEGATDNLTGEYTQRFEVDPPDDTKATWVGPVLIET